MRREYEEYKTKIERVQEEKHIIGLQIFDINEDILELQAENEKIIYLVEKLAKKLNVQRETLRMVEEKILR